MNEPGQKQEKKCPGLKGAPHCGKDRKNQGYCSDCRRIYQRNRYQTITRGSSTYTPRQHTRVDTPKCDACLTPSSSEVKPLMLNNGEAVCEVCWTWIVQLRKARGINFMNSVHRFIDAELYVPSSLPRRNSPLILDPDFERHLADVQRREAIARDPYHFPGKADDTVIGTPEWVNLQLETIERCCETGRTPSENTGSKAMLDYNRWATSVGRPQYQEEFGLPREDYTNLSFAQLTDLRLDTWFKLPQNSDPDIRVEHHDVEPDSISPQTIDYSKLNTPTKTEQTVTIEGTTYPILGTIEEPEVIDKAPVEPFTFRPSGPPTSFDDIPSPFDDD